MITFIKYFMVLFMSPKISRSRLKSFAEDHISKLTLNNPGGLFTALLTAVTNAYTAYFGDLSSESLKLAVQKAKTAGMDASRLALLAKISEIHPLILYTYRATPDVILEFYPVGTSEYYDSNIDDLETISGRLKSVLDTHSADFTPAVLTDFNTVQGTFITNRSAQRTAKDAVETERSDMATSKVTLAKQLSINLLTIAAKYIGDESKAALYFNQSIINAAFTESTHKVESDINPGETQNAFDNTTAPEIKYLISVSGPGTMYVGFAATADTVMTAANGKPVDETDDKTFTASEMGFTTEKIYLNISNPETVMLSYVIERV